MDRGLLACSSSGKRSVSYKGHGTTHAVSCYCMLLLPCKLTSNIIESKIGSKRDLSSEIPCNLQEYWYFSLGIWKTPVGSRLLAKKHPVESILLGQSVKRSKATRLSYGHSAEDGFSFAKVLLSRLRSSSGSLGESFVKAPLASESL